MIVKLELYTPEVFIACHQVILHTLGRNLCIKWILAMILVNKTNFNMMKLIKIFNTNVR